MINAIHSAMPRTRNVAHYVSTDGIKGPAISPPTLRAEVPRTQAVISDVMQAPHREAVISNAGASFWASQAMKNIDDLRFEDLLPFIFAAAI